MTQTPRSTPADSRPLSIGNIVSLAVILYRNNFKPYFLLALRATLWILVPVYGWAKFFALSALIARLSFQRLSNQPELLHEAQAQLKPRLWDFLACAVLIAIAVGGVVGIFLVGVVILAITAGATFAATGANSAWIATWVAIGLAYSFAFFIGVFWISARVMLAELPLAIEKGIDPVKTIRRSLELTHGQAWRIIGMLSIAALITLPLQVIIQAVSTLAQILPALLSEPGGDWLFVIALLSSYAIGLVGGAFLLPFWQSIKAVLYYDLRCRREGLGLQLKRNEI